jgi:UDP-glucuronate decarboxylase
MKKILVTGGAGFLGSHLIDLIFSKEPGIEIFCVDNFYTGSKENIRHHLDKKNFHLINHDISILLQDFGPIDEIYNLACPASPIHYQKDPIQTTKTSVLGIINMLELAKKNNSKILHASTSEIYGDPLQHPQSEEYWGNVNPIGVRSCYDEGKRISETLLFDYKRMYNTKIKVVRIFNTYGPRMAKDDGRVVSNFINQAINNENITIYGDGSQTRSFCYVSDLINVMYKFMKFEDDFPGPINIGNPSEFTIKELAENILSKVESSSKIIYEELPLDDPKQRKPNITVANKTLGWQPIINLDEGLINTIKFFNS